MREVFLDESEIRLILNLLPSGDVPKDLPPMFYKTLTYEGDCKIKAIADHLMEKLKD